MVLVAAVSNKASRPEAKKGCLDFHKQFSVNSFAALEEARITGNIMTSRDDESLRYESSSSSDASCEESVPLIVEYKNDDNEWKHDTVTSSNKISPADFVKEWLAFYVRFTTTAGNQDKVLKTLQWSMWLVAGILATILQHSDLSAWLQQLSVNISYARYVTRLLGMPTALEAALSGSWSTSSQNEALNRIYKIIGNILAYSMVAYYPTEHMAYALWVKPPEREPALRHYWSPEKWFYISCRFWLAYLVAELVQCFLQWRELRAQQANLLHAKKTDDSYYGRELDTSGVDLDAQLLNTVLLGLRDILVLIPCIHWSLPNWDTQPWMPVYIINSLMWAESIACLYQALKNAT
jgi:Peroxisomal biogenesis factor 11 (PEX11)